jgi:hypothetical protein
MMVKEFVVFDEIEATEMRFAIINDGEPAVSSAAIGFNCLSWRSRKDLQAASGWVVRRAK